MELQEDQSNYSIAPADIYSLLAASEKVLRMFGPFNATNHRILRLDPPNCLSRRHLLEIPYSQLKNTGRWSTTGRATSSLRCASSLARWPTS